MTGMLMALTGCAGFGGGAYYGDTLVAPGPDIYMFNDISNAHDVHHFSHRGAESRQAAHQGGHHTKVHDNSKRGKR